MTNEMTTSPQDADRDEADRLIFQMLAAIGDKLDGIESRLASTATASDVARLGSRLDADRKHNANEQKLTRSAIRDAMQGFETKLGQTEDRLADRIDDAIDAHSKDALAHPRF